MRRRIRHRRSAEHRRNAPSDVERATARRGSGTFAPERLLRTFEHGAPVEAGAIEPGGRRVVTVGDDGVVTDLDARGRSVRAPAAELQGAGDGRGFQRRRQPPCDRREGRLGGAPQRGNRGPLAQAARTQAKVAGIAFSPDGSLLVTTSKDHNAHPLGRRHRPPAFRSPGALRPRARRRLQSRRPLDRHRRARHRRSLAGQRRTVPLLPARAQGSAACMRHSPRTGGGSSRLARTAQSGRTTAMSAGRSTSSSRSPSHGSHGPAERSRLGTSAVPRAVTGPCSRHRPRARPPGRSDRQPSTGLRDSSSRGRARPGTDGARSVISRLHEGPRPARRRS